MIIISKLPEANEFMSAIESMNQKEISNDCLVAFGKYFPPINYNLLL